MAFPNIIHNGLTYEFISLSGRVQSHTSELQELSQPGKDGSAFRIFGKRGAISTYIGIRDVVTAKAGWALQAELQDLQGELIKITDDEGNQPYGIMVVRVTALGIQGIKTPTGGVHGGQGTHLLTVAFDVQLAGY